MFAKVQACLILSLLLLVGGCQLPGMAAVDDGPPIVVSEEAAASMEGKVAVAAAASGTTTISVTQEEVTSFLALRLNAAAEAQSVENPLKDPQVYFKDDGSIVLRGTISFEGQSQPMRLVASPSAADGKLALDITEAKLGPLPVPGALLNQVEGRLAEALLAGQDYTRLDSVAVTAGTLTLTGERK